MIEPLFVYLLYVLLNWYLPALVSLNELKFFLKVVFEILNLILKIQMNQSLVSNRISWPHFS